VSRASETPAARRRALGAGFRGEAGDLAFRAISRQGVDRRLARRIRRREAEAVIRSRKSRKAPRVIGAERYKDRSLVERFWAKAKVYRRVATRYEKKGRNFLTFVQVAAMMILLR
jgi:transposase